jgi:hypothetical protein
MSSVSTVGNKGADVLSSTGDARVDLNMKCVRGVVATDIYAGVQAVVDIGTAEAVEDAFVLAFHTRNIRGGKGERTVFGYLFAHLYKTLPRLAMAVLDLIPHYGYWKDLIVLANDEAPKEFTDAVVRLVVAQLEADEKPIGSRSLIAKWIPREDSKYKMLARRIAYDMFPTAFTHSAKMRLYRQKIARLNNELKTVETLMCGDRFEDIDPRTVPGRAGKIYNRAFLNLPTTYKARENPAAGEFRHPDDAKRIACREHFKDHYAKAAKGEAKVHGADTIFPHELVKKAVSSDTLTEPEKDHIRGVWRAMVTKAKTAGGLRRSIFMCDFSGSMQCSSAGDTPYWVSMALGMLGSEVCAEEYQNMIIGFDSDPHLLQFRPGSDVFERIATLREAEGFGQGLSTNFQAALDLVLKLVKEKRCRPGEEPENLIVLTDMNWDKACGSSETSTYTGYGYRHVVKTAPWETFVTTIQTAFTRAGEDMWGTGQGLTAPRIVIWNLAASPQTDYHASADTPGVAMLSGWSPSQFEILQKEGPRQMTAYEILRLELDDPKYQRVRDRIRAVLAE